MGLPTRGVWVVDGMITELLSAFKHFYKNT